MMNLTTFSKFIAEFLGTLILVLVGCSSAVLAGTSGPLGVGTLGIAFAFGLTVIALAYTIGQISGCHINPAISISMVIVGRIKASEAATYIIAQVIGAIAGAAILLFIASGKEGYQLSVNGLGQNGYGDFSPAHYSLLSGFIAETVFTLIFILVVLGCTAAKNIHGGFAGIAIGLSLTVIHIIGIPITGVSVNPARSIGPALLVGGMAIKQLWLFLVSPVLGGVLGAVIWRHILKNE
jgi:aquaporin Z